jgi:DNA-binding beta-propeller fold protein YncE
MKPGSLISAACLLLGTVCYSQKTISGFEAPESVIKSGDRLFVSNMGGTKPDPMALDSNGFISEVSTDGRVLHQKFQKGILNAPKGLAIVRDVVYAADINRVVGFNIRTGEQLFEVGIPSAKMLNDLCKVDDKHVCVSETVSGQVLLIDLTDKSIRFLGTVEGANGVTYDEKTGKLYAVGMGAKMSGGKIFVKDLKKTDTVFTSLENSPTGIFDGIEMFDKNHLIVSDWVSFSSQKGRLIIYDLDNHTAKTIDVDAGPADITYDPSSHTIFIPRMMINSLVIEDIGTLQEK